MGPEELSGQGSGSAGLQGAGCGTHEPLKQIRQGDEKIRASAAMAQRPAGRGGRTEGPVGRHGIGGEPLLSPEQREWLGLEESESIRVLASSKRTIMLERCRGDSAAFPWDRDLVLNADVRAFAIADCLHMIHSAAKSGFLFFENGSHEKAVYLHRGEVVFASSNQVVDRLGECLLRAGIISLDQHREAKRAYNPSTQLGKILVERGFITPRELWNGVKAQVEEIVRSLFSYGAGSLHFWEGEVRPDNVVRLSLPTKRLIAEGLRRRDELLKLLAWLESPRVRVRPNRDSGMELVGTERAVFDSLSETDRFDEVCRKVGIDPLSGARALNHLRLIGAVTLNEGVALEEEVSDGEGGRAGDESSVRICVEQHLAVLSELVAPIVAVEGPEGLRQRLGKVVEEASPRFPELFAALEVGPGGIPDPARVIDRALRFPGDREREVSLAFGELLSYVEFELVNHPKIDEPDLFLEAIDQLRGRL